jgi:hypothetical protein
MILEQLTPLMVKAIMVLILTEIANRYSPKWLRPRYILALLSILIVYLYKSEFLIGDSLVVMSLSVLSYEIFGKDAVTKIMKIIKERL